MRNDPAALHLKMALQHFGLAQAAADRAAADSFTIDIPDGRPTAYANAAIYADRIAFLRDCTRNLIDPSPRPRTLEPAPSGVSADAA